jgi:hypothetical protein
LVHLSFHPASESARRLARHLYGALNDDPALPGLRVPTVTVREDGTGLPPQMHDLDEAERNVVVALLDEYMVLEGEIPEGRQTWASWVGDLWAACQGQPSRRFLPIQLAADAWPLDPRLGETSFVRALDQPDETRFAWTARRLIVELCRFLQGNERGETVPVQLFLSHSRADISSAPQVFNEIVAHLNITQPVKTWIDSAEIEGGSKFTDAITAGVRDSVLLAIATQSYACRPWCRRELLMAKRNRRPFIVIDAMEDLELRSFPYAGNAPRLRWIAGGAARAVDLVLKETLRHLHVGLTLQRHQRPNDVVLSAPPELATLVRLAKGSTVLYPDPPLGDEEMDELACLGVTVETPLQRAADGRTLAKVPIVLSISESGDCEQYGVFPEQLNAAHIEISRQLLVRGACLEYGGHLGNDGYTVALFNMVREYSAISGLPPAARIVNDVGWPLPLRTLPAAELAKHQAVAIYRRVPQPSGVEDLEPTTFKAEPHAFPADDTPEHRYAWARGMTAMREFQARRTCPNDKPSSTSQPPAVARIVLGGKVGLSTNGRWYSGRIPGVVEEALISLRLGQPVYVLGAYGGAAALVIDLIEGRVRADFTWEFHRQAPQAEGMRRIYETRGPVWEDYPAMAKFFADLGVEGLASLNKLSVDENRELFRCRDVPRAIDLLLCGLTRLGGGHEPVM